MHKRTHPRNRFSVSAGVRDYFLCAYSFMRRFTNAFPSNAQISSNPQRAFLLSFLQRGSALPHPKRGQYHIQFLNQFIRASHSRETSSPDA